MLWLFNSLLVWLGIAKATTVLPKPNFKNGFQINGVDFDGDESGYLSGITPGTIAASKAVVVDANKDVLSFRDVRLRSLDAGTSGTAGDVDVYPATNAKGKFRLTCTDQTGDTIAEVNMGAQAAARTYNIPDWSTKASADTEGSIAVIKVVADTTDRPGALGCLLYATGNNKLYVCTGASATAATWTVVGSQS